MKIFVPRDAAAKALGADEVAAAVRAEAAARGLDVTVVRNGSRGMIWLEPLLEVDSPQGRIGFGPLTAADVPSVLEALQVLFPFRVDANLTSQAFQLLAAVAAPHLLLSHWLERRVRAAARR